MTSKTTEEITAELAKLQALLAKYPNIPAATFDGKGMPCTSIIKGAIAALTPGFNPMLVFLADPNTLEDQAYVQGESSAYMWARDIRAWMDWGMPDPSPALPPVPAVSDVIAAGLQTKL